MARRYLVATFALSIVLLAALPAAATATTEAGTEPATTETTAPAVIIEPAVPVDTTPAAATNPDWTYRFFIPTLLVLAGLVVIVTVIQYFTRVVRNRYRIVR
jgi:FtsP/CotA-like multicopper oxidase with cupredoxin domain